MKLLCDGWCADYDIKLKGMPKDELQEVFKDIYKYLVLNFHDQDLDKAELLRISEVVGSVQKQDPKDAQRDHGGSGDVWAGEGILRVGGDDITGKPSLFSHKHDLDWHANQPSNPNRKKLIWLYALTGTVGSRTSWLNNAWAYDDLPGDVKVQVEDLNVICGYKAGRYSDTPLFKDHLDTENPVKLIQNFGEHKGIFFPFYQIFEVVGYSEKESQELIEFLQNHILNEKYMYHHEWKNGDLNIAEQVVTIHKRWHFEQMGKRILWRVASGHENLQ